MADTLVVESRVRDFITSSKGGKDLRVGGDVAEALSAKVEVLLNEAVKRAKENGRSTVQARDF